MTSSQRLVEPNHHANYPEFAGPRAYAMGLVFLTGRSAYLRRALELVDLEPSDRVIDIGCGPGLAPREAHRRGAHVIGVDPSSEMLRLARWLVAASLHRVATRRCSHVANRRRLGDGRLVDLDRAPLARHRCRPR